MLNSDQSKYTGFLLLGICAFWAVLLLPVKSAVLGMMMVIWFSESKSNHWFTWVSITIAPFLFMALLVHVVQFPALYNMMVLTVFVMYANEVCNHLMNFADKMFQVSSD